MENWKQAVTEEARLKGYSRKTIKNYCYYIGRFLKSNKSPRDFLLALIDKKKADNTVRTVGFAIKFYLDLTKQHSTTHKNLLSNLPNVKRPKKLPVILSKKEIRRMIGGTQNLTHRLIIQIIYAAGLKMSEIVNLKWSDIDFERKTIHLKNAKGKKDRIVMLSHKVEHGLGVLSEMKNGYVFKTNRMTKYTPRTIQKIIENSSKKVGIKKKITPHSLRHTFATHLFEAGTDIRHIQELLGHANLSTTMIYTKVSNQNIVNITSPLDM